MVDAPYLQTQKKAPGLEKRFSPKKPNRREGFVQTSDQVKLHYVLHGEKGPLLVLCDGIGCDGYIWKYLIPDLAKDYRLLHWHYRGHGLSSIPRSYSSLTIAQLALDLRELLDAMDLGPAERPILLGHSMGVQVILEYCKHFRKDLGGLICICGAPGNTLDDFMNSKILKGLFPLLLQFFRSAPGFSSILWNQILANPQGYYPALLFQLTSTLCAKEDLQPYLDHLGHINSRVFMELAQDMGKHSVRDFLPEVNIPTLVFAGNRDRFTPLRSSEEIAKKIPRAEFCLVRGGTHTAPLELPELFSLRIRSFLSSI